MAVIGIDIGGTKISSAIFYEAEMLDKINILLDGKKGEAVGNLIVENISKHLSYAKRNNLKIQSIGVSVPGIYYSKSGNVWAPNIPGWENYPLLKDLKASVKGKGISINIDSDRACYILGEVWKGSAKDIKDAVFMAVGTGIGAGILVNGEVLRGSNDIAGAIGWLALDRPFMEKYINYGCFEYHASGDGIARIAKELIDIDKHYSGILRTIPDFTSRDIFEAYEHEDSLAIKVLKICTEFWGMAAANLVSIFNPEVIIFGGGVFGPGVNLIDDIYNEAKKWAQPISINQVKFLRSANGSEAGLLGAAYLALRNVKE